MQSNHDGKGLANTALMLLYCTMDAKQQFIASTGNFKMSRLASFGTLKRYQGAFSDQVFVHSLLKSVHTTYTVVVLASTQDLSVVVLQKNLEGRTE